MFLLKMILYLPSEICSFSPLLVTQVDEIYLRRVTHSAQITVYLETELLSSATKTLHCPGHQQDRRKRNIIKKITAVLFTEAHQLLHLILLLGACISTKAKTSSDFSTVFLVPSSLCPLSCQYSLSGKLLYQDVFACDNWKKMTCCEERMTSKVL